MKQFTLIFGVLLIVISCNIGSGNTAEKSRKADKTGDTVVIHEQRVMMPESSKTTRLLVIDDLPAFDKVLEVTTQIIGPENPNDHFAVYSQKYVYYTTHTQINIGAKSLGGGVVNGIFFCNYTVKGILK